MRVPAPWRVAQICAAVAGGATQLREVSGAVAPSRDPRDLDQAVDYLRHAGILCAQDSSSPGSLRLTDRGARVADLDRRSRRLGPARDAAAYRRACRELVDLAAGLGVGRGRR